MIFSRKLLHTILPQLESVSDELFQKAVRSTGNELPTKDIFKHPILNNLVIGRIVEFAPHPQSDHMNICKVVIDKQGTTKTIVCGAKNVTANKNVVVALQGCKLYDGRIIEDKMLRGVESQGMLCAYRELTPLNGNSISKDDADGIMLFDDGEIGDTNVTEFLGLDDTLYQIEIPYSNRHDIEGALAFCQDIAAYFNWEFKFPEINTNTKPLNNKISIDSSVCNGYILAKIDNISIKQSNWELKSLLMNNGIMPLNNLLDDLNYITLLTNNATAAYDGDKINDISVEKANNGDTFIGFDKKEYSLTNNDVVVKSNGKIICLAGILGENEYGINVNTKSAYIEIANFNYATIRKTAQRLAIQTPSARKNSKEITTYNTMVAAQLLTDKFQASLIGVEWKIKENDAISCQLNLNYINKIIGIDIPKEQAINNLASLGFKVDGENVLFPKWRTDLISTPDLAEEILKKIDINNDLAEQPIISDMANPNKKYTDFYFIMKMWDVLTNNYFSEVKTYNLIPKELANVFNVYSYKNNVEVTSSTLSRALMRNNLIHNMLEIYSFNNKRKTPLIPIFELQKIYQSNQSKSDWNLTVIAPNKHIFDAINDSKIIYNLNTLKSVILEVAKIFKTTVQFTPKKVLNCYENESLEIIYKDKVIGYMGSIQKSVLKNYSINEDIYFATINWNYLFNDFVAEDNFKTEIIKISPFMSLYKDLTFVHPKNSIMQPTIDKLNNLSFFEKVEFIGKFNREECQTYTLRVYFKNNNNISNEDINTWMNEVIRIFEIDGFKLNTLI